MKPGPKPRKSRTLDDVGTEAVTTMIIEGITYREIAGSFKVSAATLVAWMEVNSERSRACARARELSAQAFEERAEQELRRARDPFELAKAKELAAHWRWRAKAVNPRQYGERIDVKNEVSVRDISDQDLIAQLAALGVDLPMPGAMPQRLTAVTIEDATVKYRLQEE